jgi:hypothetical protein
MTKIIVLLLIGFTITIASNNNSTTDGHERATCWELCTTDGHERAMCTEACGKCTPGDSVVVQDEILKRWQRRHSFQRVDVITWYASCALRYEGIHTYKTGGPLPRPDLPTPDSSIYILNFRFVSSLTNGANKIHLRLRSRNDSNGRDGRSFTPPIRFLYNTTRSRRTQFLRPPSASSCVLHTHSDTSPAQASMPLSDRIRGASNTHSSAKKGVNE